jgi:hypothetical protein
MAGNTPAVVGEAQNDAAALTTSVRLASPIGLETFSVLGALNDLSLF